ncbi:hypothetical protein [Corynebacterium variabile]|uniref:hypothetical protein n=1 Tax=Corynebacterium variabile TaxID=1727 RepID=UPI003F93BF0A
MHHNEQSPAPVAAGTRETNNYQADRTDNDTRTAPKPRKLKHRTWHFHVGATDDGLPMGLCGWVVPGRKCLTSPTGPKKTDECIPRQCPDCAAIVEMQRDAVNRRDRAEKLTEFILDALDEKGL